MTMQILSITEWADREGIERRKAYRWATEGKIPTVTRKIEAMGIPENITKNDIVK